jgi:hypothetical protein
VENEEDKSPTVFTFYIGSGIISLCASKLDGGPRGYG